MTSLELLTLVREQENFLSETLRCQVIPRVYKLVGDKLIMFDEPIKEHFHGIAKNGEGALLAMDENGMVSNISTSPLFYNALLYVDILRKLEGQMYSEFPNPIINDFPVRDALKQNYTNH